MVSINPDGASKRTKYCAEFVKSTYKKATGKDMSLKQGKIESGALFVKKALNKAGIDAPRGNILSFFKEMPTEKSLIGKGFEKNESYVDTNGGTYYYNKSTDESVRVNTSWKGNGNTCFEHKKGNTQTSFIYDKDGRPLEGDIQIKQKDGTIQIVKFTVDANGQKVMQEPTFEITDNFIGHDGKY